MKHFFTIDLSTTCHSLNVLTSSVRPANSFRKLNKSTTHFLFDSTPSQKGLIRINSWLTMALQDLIQINSRLKWIYEVWFQSTHDSKSSQIFYSNQLTTQENFSESWVESTHDSIMLFIPSFVWHFLGIEPYWWLGWLFWAFHSSVNFVWPFWAFDSSAFPDKLIRISSWLKQYLGDLNRFNWWLKHLSRNWLRIISWLKWIPKIDSLVLPDFSIQTNS